MRKTLYVINGIFLTKRLTGIERYALNMVRELDKLVRHGRFILLVPMSCKKDMALKNIRILKYGRFKGYLWEQTDLAAFARKHRAKLISFTNSVPVFYPKGLVYLHDISMEVNKKMFCTSLRGVLSVIFWCIMYRTIMSSGLRIVTVSGFSKSEIMRVYNIDEKRISVINSGWQHMEEIAPDTGILNKYGLKKGSYYFGMATAAPNKNMKWIIEAARQHKDFCFVLSGNGSDKLLKGKRPKNLILTGYVSDSEAKALMGNCRAFLFPTFYEGFGLPPMEALSSGAGGVIVSDTPCMHEIYEDIATYINPHDYANTKLNVKEHSASEIRDFLNDYSWEASAQKFYSLLET